MNEYDSFNGKRKNSETRTCFEYLRYVIVPLILGLFGIGALTIIIAPTVIFGDQNNNPTSPTQTPTRVISPTSIPPTNVITTPSIGGQSLDQPCFCDPPGCELGTLALGSTFSPRAPADDVQYYAAQSNQSDGYYFTIYPITQSFTCSSPSTGCAVFGYYSTQSCAIAEMNRECNKQGRLCGSVDTAP